MNVADTAWSVAFGRRLTIANLFPRSREQRDLLGMLTEEFVDGGYSLVELLVAITTHPYFNGGPDHIYEAVFDPFVPTEEGATPQNHLGHTIHRLPARMLLSSAFTALGWPGLPEYLVYFLSPNAEAQRNAGVYLKSGDPGFPGISFQSALAWESLVGVCEDRSLDATCPLQPILDSPEAREATVCELCNSAESACAWDARCCDIDWTLYCDASGCDTGDPRVIDLATFPSPEAPESPDTITRLLKRAADDADATVEDAIAALKDRILGDPRLEDLREREAVEGLFGAALSSRLADVDDAEAGLRRVCGVLLASPQFLLMGWPGAADPAETPRLSEATMDRVCQDLGPVLFDPGEDMCGSSR